MFTFNKCQRIDQQKLQDSARTTHAPGFFNLLTAPALYDTVQSLLPRHRERVFAPADTLSLFLAQALSWDRSCQNALKQAVIQRLNQGFPLGNTATGGYCRARQKLPTAMVSARVRSSERLIDQ